MKKSIELLNEAAFAICVALEAMVALLLMLACAAWKISLNESLTTGFHRDFEKKEKHFPAYNGRLAK